MTLDRSTHRRIVALAIVGFILRAAFGLLYWNGKPLTHDEQEYLALARSLTDGRGFAYAPEDAAGTTQQFGRAPGYPAFLAAIGAGRHAHADAPDAVQMAQALAGAATIYLIAAIAARAAGSRAAVAAAAIAAVYPPLVFIPAYVFSETIYSALALLAAHTLQRSVDAPGGPVQTRLAIAAGATAGVAVLTRPAMLFFLPIALLWTWRRGGVRTGVLFVAVAAAAIAPWTLRNFHEHGRFVLVASEGGVTFWTGNHPLARGEGDLAANPELKAAELEFRRAHPGLTAEQLEPLYYRDAVQFITTHPLRWAGLLARKLFYTVVPIGPSYTLHSTRYWAASVLSYLMLLPAAVYGLTRLRGAAQPPAAVLWLGASAVLAGLIFFPQERFRIPVIDPVLIISAAAAVGRRGDARGASA